MTTDEKTAINTTLLRKVAAQIQKSPERYDQGVYCGYSYGCGTIHCIAGWCLRFKHPRMSDERFVDFEKPIDIHNTAEKELRLTPEQASYLFSSTWTPWKKGDSVPTALRKLCTTKGRRECTRVTGVRW